MKRIVIYRHAVRAIILGFLFSTLFACGGGSNGSTTQQASTTQYSGVAQKGPFEVGSTVSVSHLDSFGIPTNNTFETTVQDNKGTFTVSIPNDLAQTSPAIQIKVDGFFLNESDGTKSTNKSSLVSITDNPNSSSVNLLTSWAATRTKVLLQAGQTLKQALQQSEKELTDIFGVENVRQLNISQNENFPSDNAQLLLLSGVLMDVVQQTVVNPQVIIDEIASDFAEDGKLTEFGNDWFILMQARIRDNPQLHTNEFAKVLRDKRGLNAPSGKALPNVITLASRPVAIVPPEIFAEPSETVVLDGSASHDSGEIINFTWFRVDQQTEFVVPLSDRFADSSSITVPNQEAELLFALVVTDADKLTDTSVVKVIVKVPPPENDPPIADSQINTNRIVINEDNSVNILLTGSDPNNDPLTFVIDTPLLLPHGLLQGTAPDLTYTPTQNYFGPDSFTFLVNDGFEDSNVATVDIVVNPVNDPPVANAGVDQTTQSSRVNPPNGGFLESTQAITLDGSASFDIEDAPGDLTYSWMQSSGPVTINPADIANVVQPTFTIASTVLNEAIDGDYVFQLIVTDTNGADSVADDVMITVTSAPPVNTAPVANAGPDQAVISSRINVGSGFFESTPLITLDGSNSSDIEDVTADLTFNWIQISGPVTIDPTDIANVIQPSFGINGALNQDIDGDYIFRLIVTDTDGAVSDPDDVTITVSPTVVANLPPNAIATFDGVGPFNEGAQVQLRGSESSDDDGTIVSYLWEQIGTPLVALIDPNIVDPTFIAPTVITAPLSLTFRLTVTDNDGATSFDETTISINGRPIAGPVADFTLSGNSTEIITLSGSDPEGGILTYKITSPPTNGLISGVMVNVPFTSPDIIYSPNNLPPDADSFIFTVIDDNGFESAPVTVNLIVGNNAPIASSQSLTIPSPVGLDIDLHDYAFDPDGDAITFELVGTPNQGGIDLTFSPSFATDGKVNAFPLDTGVNASFQYKVIDEHGAESNTETISIVF